MNFSRVLWEALGRQRWFSAGRQRPSRRPPLGRHSRGAPPPLSPGAPRALLVSLTAVYNASRPEKCDVEDARLKELTKEMGQLETLKTATLICKTCQKRLLIDKPVGNKLYCTCEKNKAVEDESGWQPFLETEDIIIWRREEDPGTGLYAYKVYGRYPEVTAVDFLAMHTDLAYWRSWDDTVLGLRKLTQPPNHHDQQEVIHWETLWPRFFANRDYVYVRRYAYMDSEGSKRPMPANKTQNINNNSKNEAPTKNNIKSDIQNQSTNFDCIQKKIYEEHQNKTDNSGYSQKNRSKILPDGGKILVENRAYEWNNGRRFGDRSSSKVIVMSSQSCEHPDAPETKRAYRVKRYWSNLVIKPFKEVDQPGIEFSLTYFDDPGTSIPSALQSWVAGHACPDFLDKMRHAAASYKTTAHQDTSIMDEIMKVSENTQSASNDTVLLAPMSEAKVDPVQQKETVQSADLQNQLHIKGAEIDSSQVDETTAPEKKQPPTKTENERQTEELLNLLYGLPSELDPPSKTKTEEIVKKPDENNNRINNDDKEEKIVIEEVVVVEDVKINKMDEKPRVELTVKSKIVSQEQRNDAQMKDQGMSYWHMWPLYYFA